MEERQFFVDGDNDKHPTYCGTGTEDYFGGAWGFGETFTGPFLGYPLWDKREGGIPRHARYRWHIMDPVRFEKDFRATVQALGWWPGASSSRSPTTSRRSATGIRLSPTGSSRYTRN